MSNVQSPSFPEYVFLLACCLGRYHHLHLCLASIYLVFHSYGLKGFLSDHTVRSQIENSSKVIPDKVLQYQIYSQASHLHSLQSLIFVDPCCRIGKSCLPVDLEHHFDSCLLSFPAFAGLILVVERCH